MKLYPLPRILTGLLLVLPLLAPPLQAQTLPAAVPAATPLNLHSVRTISPADEDFADLEFLRQEIGAARVVMLGEPTHGEGNVTEAKIRLINFLRQRMGFTTVAFESGFYELDRGQRAIEAGVAVREAVEGGVFPIWTATQEFQALLPALGPGGLRIAGFDYQLTGPYQDDLLEELEAFLRPEKGAESIAYDYLDECLSTMGEIFIFPPSHQLPLFELQLGKARRLLTKVAAGPNAARRERAAFWLQNLRSLQALARDYAHNDPSAKSSQEFKAVDSNPRDAQMADNLLWYLRQHPNEKVICWAALPHLANKLDDFASEELQTYRPIGRAVKAALGPDAVYILGTLAGSGTYLDFGLQTVPPPAAGSLEAALLARGAEYAFVSLKHDAPGQVLTTYAFQYEPVTGPWSEAVDGFLYLRAVRPPRPAATAAQPPLPADTTQARKPGRKQPPLLASNQRFRRTAPAASVALRGTVLDGSTGRPVPFSSVAVPARAAGTVANAEGQFTLPVRPGELVQVSSVGYETVVLAAHPRGEWVVRLRPTSYALADVQVSARSQNPRKIMQRVIQAAATNYEQQDYTARVYSHRRVANFDTLLREAEYVSEVFEPAGYRHWGGGMLMMGDVPTHRVLEKHVLTSPRKPAEDWSMFDGGMGFSAASANVVRISPLFKTSTLRRFTLRLDSIVQHGGETYYVIGFAAKRSSRRTTGTYLQSGYSGKLHIRQQDYAVLRYEATWQYDTLKHNAVARKYFGRHNLAARLYNEVYASNRTVHVVSYAKSGNGRYQVVCSAGQNRSVGRVLGGAAFHTQSSCEAYFSPLPGSPADGPPELGKEVGPKLGEIEGLRHVAYRPEFWQTYQRPVPAGSAPEPLATKP